MTVSILVASATLVALTVLPEDKGARPESSQDGGFLELIRRTDLLRIFGVGFEAPLCAGY